jgi:DNA-binding protein HU-beta
VTKQEFVGKVASKSGLSQRDAAKAVDAFLDSITEALKSGDPVSFTGFGKFSTSRRAAREGVNPRNPGQKVYIPEATVPKFSAGSSLKQAVKAGGAGAGSTF